MLCSIHGLAGTKLRSFSGREISFFGVHSALNAHGLMPMMQLLSTLLAFGVCSVALPASSSPRRLHTVSGVSSGGDMAMIHAVAFSSAHNGVAVIAGAPYGCNAIVHPGREVL